MLRPPDREPPPEFTSREQEEGLIGRRMRAFAERSREPGDSATWTVVLGSLICTVLIICFSVSGHPMLAVAGLGLFGIYAAVLGAVGRVNVFSILWGSAATDGDHVANEFAIHLATLAISLISLIAVLISAFTGWGFGWWGFVLLAVVAIYLIVYIRTVAAVMRS